MKLGKRKEGRRLKRRTEMKCVRVGGEMEERGREREGGAGRTTFTGEVWSALPPGLVSLTVPGWHARGELARVSACKGNCI